MIVTHVKRNSVVAESAWLHRPRFLFRVESLVFFFFDNTNGRAITMV